MCTEGGEVSNLPLRRICTLVLALAFALVAQPLLASTIRYRTDAELIALSERVVHARVIAQRTVWGGPNLDRIYTVTTLEVLEDLTGRAGDRVEVWEMGGVIGDRAEDVGGQVTYEIGREVIVCLGRGTQGLRSVAMRFSKFDVRRTSAGEESLVRNLRETLVVGAPAQSANRSLAEFRRLAEQVTGRRSRRVQREAGDRPQSVEAPFTLLGNFRWAEADTATPVAWRRNLTATSPLTSGAIDTEIGVALAAWTNPPSASLILQFAGTTTQLDPQEWLHRWRHHLRRSQQRDQRPRPGDWGRRVYGVHQLDGQQHRLHQLHSRVCDLRQRGDAGP